LGFSKERKPTNEETPFVQVQLCDTTEAFGNEGQGMAVAAYINYSSEKNFQSNSIERKCELGMAFSFEYGNDRGLKIGRFQPFNVYPVAAPRTLCHVNEENGDVFITLTKVPPKNSKKAPVVLIDRCKLTASGT
jgi:hypothetical protein